MEGTVPETGNLHATLGIEDNKFSGEDNYGLAFLNITDDGAPEVPTKIDSINYDTVFKQSGGKLNPTWILLDNQSIVNVFSNPDMVVNIRETSREMHVYCDAGKVIIRTVADWPGFVEVWFHRGGIANILSLVLVKEMFRITYDIAMGTDANTFVVHKKDGNQRKFVQSTWGLYYCDVSDNSKKNAFALVNSVADNEKNYSKKYVKKSYKARNFQQTISNVSTKTLLQIVDNHELKNCPITREHVRVAEDILGPNIQSL